MLLIVNKSVGCNPIKGAMVPMVVPVVVSIQKKSHLAIDVLRAGRQLDHLRLGLCGSDAKISLAPRDSRFWKFLTLALD
jgi:hypothetical protein